VPSSMSESKDRHDFVSQLAARLEKGAHEYGNKSFDRPFGDIADEILQEYLDIAGWSYVMWAKTRARLSELEMRVDNCRPYPDDCC